MWPVNFLAEYFAQALQVFASLCSVCFIYLSVRLSVCPSVTSRCFTEMRSGVPKGMGES